MIRLFVAFPIRGLIADSFLKISSDNSSVENIRWTIRNNLHITLFFIGEIEESDLDSVKWCLQKLFLAEQSFNLEFDKIEVKGQKRSMLWARFKSDKRFSELSEKIYQCIKQFMTIKRVHEDPVPHCTLARMKSNADVSSFNTEIILPDKKIKIDCAELWKTVETKDGVRYQCLEKYLMQG